MEFLIYTRLVLVMAAVCPSYNWTETFFFFDNSKLVIFGATCHCCYFFSLSVFGCGCLCKLLSHRFDFVLKRIQGEFILPSKNDTPDGMLHKSMGFLSHVYLKIDRKQTFGKGRTLHQKKLTDSKGHSDLFTTSGSSWWQRKASKWCNT